MNTADFEFDLPPDLIAQQPAPKRTQARMMIIQRATGAIEHRHVSDLPGYLRNNDLLVVNDTRVFPARLFGRKLPGGGRIEILLIEPLSDSQTWDVLLRSSHVPKPGAQLILADEQIRAEVLEMGHGGHVTLRLSSDRPLMEIIENKGVVPLPPYIKRPRTITDGPQTAEDRQRYQTVYARHTGAVAAPTAGLHFTPELIQSLESIGVRRAAITLHVGPGTFKPVTTPQVEDHPMDSERYVIPSETAALIQDAHARKGRVVAVGSTVARTLETVAAAQGAIIPSAGRSALFIYPPYPFKVVDAMLTNFHLPASTLIMMVCAFAGQALTLDAYRLAVRERYRFYSYGDCMLIL